MATTKSRTAVSAALLLYSAAIVVFALYPTALVDWAEWVAIVLGVVSMIGLVANLLPGVRLPGEQYAYLVTGWAGATVLLLYLIDVNEAPDYEQWRNTLLLMSGSVGGYGAYLAQEDGHG